jgi:hypothetical protein
MAVSSIKTGIEFAEYKFTTNIGNDKANDKQRNGVTLQQGTRKDNFLKNI